MKYIIDKDTIYLRIDKGEEVCSSLLKIAKELNINSASISGLGASNEFTVGVFDLDKKEFIGNNFKTEYEITNLTGNLSLKDNLPYLLLHGTFANLKEVVGGHVTKCIISLTAEIVIKKTNKKINRIFDNETGLNLWDF